MKSKAGDQVHCAMSALFSERRSFSESKLLANIAVQALLPSLRSYPDPVFVIPCTCDSLWMNVCARQLSDGVCVAHVYLWKCWWYQNNSFIAKVGSHNCQYYLPDIRKRQLVSESVPCVSHCRAASLSLRKRSLPKSWRKLVWTNNWLNFARKADGEPWFCRLWYAWCDLLFGNTCRIRFVLAWCRLLHSLTEVNQ